MATYALVHGGAHGGGCFDLLARELRDRGHDVVAPDLPIDDADATLTDHARVVVDAMGDATDVVVVAHSLGGLVGPIVASMIDADLLVLLAAMVPMPGESCLEMWEATDYSPAVPDGDGGQIEVDLDGGDESILGAETAIAAFYHDVPRDVALDAVSKLRVQDLTMMAEPWPLESWPDLPIRYLLCRDDRILPPDWSRRVVADRLGIAPDEIDGGHSPFLGRPAELADRLEGYRIALG